MTKGGIKGKTASIIEHPGGFVANTISRLFVALGAAIVLVVFNTFAEPVKIITGWLRAWVGPEKVTDEKWKDLVKWTEIGFYISFMLALMPGGMKSLTKSKMKM